MFTCAGRLIDFVCFAGFNLNIIISFVDFCLNEVVVCLKENVVLGMISFDKEA